MDSNKNAWKWCFDNYKIVKIIRASERISFQRKSNRYNRGLTISKEAFLNMDDITLTPGRKIELEPNVVLMNDLPKRISLIKYCVTHDGKKCEGGLFNFSLKEWCYFWNKLRGEIAAKLQNM